MRYYLDEDLSNVIAEIGRERFGLDIDSAQALGMEQATDAEQLAFAAREQRYLVTRDGRDFLRLTADFLRESLPHPGIVVVPSSLSGKEFLRIATALADIHSRYPEDNVPFLVVYLSEAPAVG